MKLRVGIEAEVQERRGQLARIEERAQARDEDIEARLTEIARREQGLADREESSKALHQQLKEAKQRSMKIFGVVGRDGGYTKQVGDCVVVVPTVEASRVTPHTEAFQAVVWHCLVSHPKLQQISTKW